MTVRAVIIGLLAAAIIPVAGYFSDQVLRGTIFVGSQFPIGVFGPLVAVMVLVFVIGRGRRPRGAEAAIVLAMALAACNIPGGGLLRMLTRSIAMPLHFNKGNKAWEEAGVIKRVPPVMLPNEGRYDRRFLESFRLETKPRIAPGSLPWDKWARPLSFWGLLALLLGIASISLALIVHRQWSRWERLRYPIAEFANTLLGSPTGGETSIFRSRLFWLGLLLLFGLHLVNGLAVRWPDTMISIPRSFPFEIILNKFPKLRAHPLTAYLFNVNIWPMVVAFGFLIASDVSLSLGLSQVFAAVIAAWLIRGMGLRMEGSADQGSPEGWQRAGSCIAIAVTLLYTGRLYYRQVLAGAFTFRRSGRTDNHAAWACRVFFLSVAAMVVMLHSVGLPWPLGLMLVAMIMLIYLVQARINAESGLVFSLLGWLPSVVLLGLFGAKALGPNAFIICGLVGAIFARDTHECLMPFILNGLWVSQRQGLRPRRVGVAAGGAFVLALLVGVPFGVWVDHNFGAEQGEKFATLVAPRMTFGAATSVVEQLKRSQDLRESERMSTWQRFASIRPNSRFLWSIGIGFAAVVLVSAMRLRFTWWPIHPIMFLVWGTWAMAILSHSFLLGWAIKRAVTKFGGSRTYEKARLLMFGVIAGELLGGLLWLIVGAIYYAATGDKPTRYDVFPGGA